MSAWRADLAAYGRRASVGQALIAWVANPGFALACHYRLAHWAVTRGRAGRILALFIERRMIAHFACHVSARARIGPGLRLPHPVGIVIGEAVVIGPDATVYHGVTLGRQRTHDTDYPRVGDRVTLFCGATLLGPVVIDDGDCVAAHRLMLSEDRAAVPGARATMR